MEIFRHYSTIGIEGFVRGPSYPLPATYLQFPSIVAPRPPSTSSFCSWEITGVLKERPEDFVVREILPKDKAKISKTLFLCNKIMNGTLLTSEGGNGVHDSGHRLDIAMLPLRAPIKLPSYNTNSSIQLKNDRIENKVLDKKLRHQNLVGKMTPSLVKPTAMKITSASSSGGTSDLAKLSFKKIVRMYIEEVSTPERPASVLLKSIKKLHEKAMNRIPISHDNGEPLGGLAGRAPSSWKNESIKKSEVWIPPLHLSGRVIEKESHRNTNETKAAKITHVKDSVKRAQRKAFHQAFKISFPFLKTESSAYFYCSHNCSDSKPLNEEKGKLNDSQWIKISIDNYFDEIINYLCTPRDDLRQLFLFRHCSDLSKQSSFIVLRLRPGLSKDDRRAMHHILALKNKYFESSIRRHGFEKKKYAKSMPKQTGQKVDKEVMPQAVFDLVVKWKKQMLRRKLKKKRRKVENGVDCSSGENMVQNFLCILKKTQKEHLTAIQILSRNLKCHQSDIGFAGIKDMQAITYQFITLRNMSQYCVERAIEQQLRNRDVQLKVLCSNVDFALNVGDLEGNQFEITLRNVKRVKVNWATHSKNGDFSEHAKESFVDCDSEHIDRMIGRIQQYGFINFYGEQRIGKPGKSEEVGVRAHEIGRAMLRQDFVEAINLLMEGTSYNEKDEVHRVRRAWKDSNGDPTIALKAFRGGDIMPRERAVLRGLKRYPDNKLEAIRFLSYNMRMFYINAYQSYVFNRVASQRIKLYGAKVIKGDLYFDKDGNHQSNIRVVEGNEVQTVKLSQILLPLPGYNIQYPKNEIGKFYKDILNIDGVEFKKNVPVESTANGSYRKLVMHPGHLTFETNSADLNSECLKLSFQLPKGSYATMLLRELMLTTVARVNK